MCWSRSRCPTSVKPIRGAPETGWGIRVSSSKLDRGDDDRGSDRGGAGCAGSEAASSTVAPRSEGPRNPGQRAPHLSNERGSDARIRDSAARATARHGLVRQRHGARRWSRAAPTRRGAALPGHPCRRGSERPSSPLKKPLLRLRARSRCCVELVGPCSAARKAACAVPLSLSLHRERALCLATRLHQRAPGAPCVDTPPAGG